MIGNQYLNSMCAPIMVVELHSFKEVTAKFWSVREKNPFMGLYCTYMLEDLLLGKIAASPSVYAPH